MGEEMNGCSHPGVKKLLVTLAALAALAPAGAAQAASTARALHHANQTSTNWSGYVASGAGQSFSDVKGTWVQPTVTCTKPATGYSSFWVGIGGSAPSSAGLEQIGTSADCRDGTPVYSAWWEILPAASVAIPFTPAPGDSITGEVAITGTAVTLTLTDTTSGATFTNTVTVAAPDTTSADWIAEAPSQCTGRRCSVLPLAAFGTAVFSAGSATANGHTGTIGDTAWSSAPIDLHGAAGGASTTTGALGADLASFSVTAAAPASASRPAPAPRSRRARSWHPRHR
jgi:hypothetical protein